MDVNKQNAAPDVTAGTATGQHLCNHKQSISNEAPAGNENFAGPGKTALQEISMTDLYDRVYEPKAPVVEGLLYPGTYIFAA